MKNQLNFPLGVLVIIFLMGFYGPETYAQKAKKDKIRLTVDYVKIMNGEIYFDIKAGARIDNQNVEVPNIELSVTNEIGDEEKDLGKVVTDMTGKTRLKLDGINAIEPDSSNTYTVVVSFKGNDKFRKASKSVSFKDVQIEATLIEKDSLHYISAVLKDTESGDPIADQPLHVQLQRLFRPLPIGKQLNMTDEEGAIRVKIDDDLPGVDGNLTLAVVLKESDDYGTVKAMINAPIGVPIVDESTFDQRTMWSPRKKTPLFLLIFPNLITFGMWGFILYFVVNLYKIYKS